MKIKCVLRYYCDYCKKSKGTPQSMVHHELHCTMNPNRKCGMCEYMQETQEPIDALKAALILPKITTIGGFDGFDVENPLIKIRELTTCPACILSAIRQSGFSTYEYHNWFDFDAEMEVLLKDYAAYYKGEMY